MWPIYFFGGWNFFKNKGHYCRTLGFNLPRILRGQTPRVIKYANMLIMFWGQLSGGQLSGGGGIVRGEIVRGGGAIVRGQLSGGQLSGGQLSRGWGQLSGGQLSGGNCQDTIFIMPRKCCTVFDRESCRANYDETKNKSHEKVTVYGFPRPPEEER